MNKYDLVEIRNKERLRVELVIKRDGLEAGLNFCKRTLALYQKALRYSCPDPAKPKHHFSRTREHLPEFIGSVLEFKKILGEHGKLGNS